MKILHSLSIVIFSLGVIGNASASLTAEWKFNETGGTTAYDSIGNINGTLVGNASFTGTGGISGGAVQLSSGGYVDMGNNFPSTSIFSIEAWVKIAPGDTSGSMTVVSKHWGGLEQGYFLAINNPASPPYYPSNLEMFYSANGPFHQAALSNVALDNGQWHELVGVYNNGATSIYVDGSLAGTGSAGYANNNANFIVGGVGGNGINGQPYGNYQGLISDVQVYNTALSGTDVNTLYKSFQTPVPIPSAIWLFGSALVGFIGFNRRKTTQQ